jgi:hypothetical protein
MTLRAKNVDGASTSANTRDHWFTRPARRRRTPTATRPNGGEIMETIWMWITSSFASPADLGAVETAAAAVSLGWSFAALYAIHRLGRQGEAVDDVRYDEAA